MFTYDLTTDGALKPSLFKGGTLLATVRTPIALTPAQLAHVFKLAQAARGDATVYMASFPVGGSFLPAHVSAWAA